MNRLVKVTRQDDIFNEYKDTPISRLLEYHNLGETNENISDAELLIGTCMDNRVQLNIPKNFAYVIRTGGSNLHNSSFYVSYALAAGGAKAIAIIVHSDCGMVNLGGRKDKIVNGIVRATGWKRIYAEDYFKSYAPVCEIVNEVNFAISEVKRLRETYPTVLIAPLLYNVEDDLLYLIDEEKTNETWGKSSLELRNKNY